MHSLSIPTWIVHVSSVIEWIVAIWLIWRYGEIQGDRAWKWFALAMLPAFVSAMCACTWHFFENLASLEWLVTLQAATTVLGNSTLCLAAWGLWRSSRSEKLEEN
ncbi:DUF2499 domain-containing protein [Spirulina sp. 06S082]|uniref:DUF2499 domain-containing protein n=1 Tax=Spirulina sp. 06S082 TaxID=3110248 RepID=UPI002B1F5CD0|nr:DUF2499 domain-containing protein [Spirulina sp. 06S082]MEA5471015.1 DUF2499 domain-containing protein [Spirulina sp. 06S082]